MAAITGVDRGLSTSGGGCVFDPAVDSLSVNLFASEAVVQLSQEL